MSAERLGGYVRMMASPGLRFLSPGASGIEGAAVQIPGRAAPALTEAR